MGNDPRPASPTRALSNPARRRLLKVGAAGVVALAIASGVLWFRSREGPKASATLDAEARAIVAAIVPSMLDGALPADPAARRQAVADTVAAIDLAIAGLAPAARAELAQLFTLLSLTPGRRVFADVPTPWAEAPADEIDAFLDNWRRSAWALKRSAYDGLHQLVMAAWYAQPGAWPAIGYPGPPSLAT